MEGYEGFPVEQVIISELSEKILKGRTYRTIPASLVSYTKF